MYFICECAACLFVVTIGMALLFTVCATFLVLEEGCSVVKRKFQELTNSDIPLFGRWTPAEPHKP
jgi:hypothetical protein